MAFTEFYCQSGGNNLNSGSTNSNTAVYTSVNGNWSTTTNQFIPTDGSTPASSVNVGDYVHIYLDAATTTILIARVTAVAAGANGAISISLSNRCGTAPITGTTGRSLKCGGAWKGPTGASAGPLGMGTGFQNCVNTTNHRPRINMKNDATYAMTASMTFNTPSASTVQGYTSTPGDGGKAILDLGSTASIGFNLGAALGCWVDLIFASSATSGSADLVTGNATMFWLMRCVAHGARGAGFSSSGGSGCAFIDCEAYDCGKANVASKAGFITFVPTTYINCVSHENAGSNSSGFIGAAAGSAVISYINCIAESNGKCGFEVLTQSTGNYYHYVNCDAYNNTGDGILLAGTTSIANSYIPIIRNCNLIKNGGSGINLVVGSGGASHSGFLNNNGYGAGTQANGAADVLSDASSVGAVTYPNDVTPWSNPGTGNFSIALTQAIGAGFGTYTQTGAGFSGTVGYPDIGSAQALVVAADEGIGVVGGG